jgi:hypothetical protein
MRQQEIEATLSALKATWEQFSTMRLCQLILNACGEDPFYFSDLTLVEKLEQYTARGAFGTKPMPTKHASNRTLSLMEYVSGGPKTK